MALGRLRLFRCVCNHKLRYGVRSCRYCFRPAPLYNRISFLLAVIALGAAAYVLWAFG